MHYYVGLESSVDQTASTNGSVLEEEWLQIDVQVAPLSTSKLITLPITF